MANRKFEKVQALEKEIKNLYLEVAIGATGAPTLSRGTGAASIARDSAGKYTITLQDKYMRLMWADVVQLETDMEDLTWQLLSETVATDKTVVIQAHAAAVATDPTSGSKLLIKLELKNSSVV